jgi:DNA-directed RNA polymerase specialized sigma subunit
MYGILNPMKNLSHRFQENVVDQFIFLRSRQERQDARAERKENRQERREKLREFFGIQKKETQKALDNTSSDVTASLPKTVKENPRYNKDAVKTAFETKERFENKMNLVETKNTVSEKNPVKEYNLNYVETNLYAQRKNILAQRPLVLNMVALDAIEDRIQILSLIESATKPAARVFIRGSLKNGTISKRFL